MKTITRAPRLDAGSLFFTRVLVGIDGSQQALEAARQAALLMHPDGLLTLVAAWDVPTRILGGTAIAVPLRYDPGQPRRTGEQAVLAACEYVAPYADAVGELVRGDPVARLRGEAEQHRATLVAIGSSGAGRLRGIVEGRVATEIIHGAPCSVLVARPAGERFPRRVVVGVDGSLESAAAYAAARYVADRFDAELLALAARGGQNLDEELVAAITHGAHEDTGEAPATAIAAASETADLVVVGSRGLHALRALGSVSERVAHTASCSALVVRESAWHRRQAP
jgi:nucleotide-binding universal stress UspA family protein